MTGAFEEHHCTEDIDLNDNGLVCNQEPDKDIRILEIDEARLLSIYEITEASAVAIA
ncbi:MAG: hypothetical protein GWO10_04440, partial [candidate division Zixibacteria bacterium]|nr:hypothetical protein [candidate division Zixibacteria bacterium]NIS45050.1 hypothetical protein [candidate division Zixibacteria bacterium]